jgi:hypothetical protein
MLFQFQLRPVKDVEPWGNEGDFSLSWFGLTDGWYWMNCGDQELFRYDDAVLTAWHAKGLVPTDPPYVDYQVVRLWEDMLEMLPDVLDPVPVELRQRVEPNPMVGKWSAQPWKDLWTNWRELSEAELDLLCAATGWLSNRTLDVGHLNHGPRIWFWTDGATLFIRWNNEGLYLDGLREWSSIEGSYSMPLDAFVEEVRSFDRRLIGAMALRVKEIRHSWDRPAIQIDRDALVREQGQRAGKLSLILERVKIREPAPWKAVSEAIEFFEKKGWRFPR